MDTRFFGGHAIERLLIGLVPDCQAETSGGASYTWLFVLESRQGMVVLMAMTQPVVAGVGAVLRASVFAEAAAVPVVKEVVLRLARPESG